MASTELNPVRSLTGDREELADPYHSRLLIRRPAELVELAELVYRGVFGAGLLVASIATLYATILGVLQPPGHRTIGIVVCSLLLLVQLLATRERRRLYPLLRRWPWLVLVPAVAIGAAAWAAGSYNQQLFFVLTILLGVLGAAVPLRVVTTSALVAAAGMAAPHISDGSWTIGVAVAAGLLPPLFWLILEQFAGFMLRLHRSQESSSRHPPKRVWIWVDRRPATHAPAATDRADPLQDEATAVGTNTAGGPYGVDLTARQLEVLLLCAEGLQHGEIGECLQIGAVQVGRHLKEACKRAQVATNAELMAWAIARGLLPPSEGAR